MCCRYALCCFWYFEFRIPKSLPTGRQAPSALRRANFFMNETANLFQRIQLTIKDATPETLRVYFFNFLAI
jgi:hypothetical protein